MKNKPRETKKQKRNQQIIIGVFVIFFVAVLLIAGRQNEVQGVNIAKIGESIGDFELINLYGESVTLSDYQGKTVLINAWATWCPPCRAEMPALEAFYQQNKELGFEILAVNAGDTQPIAAEFVTANGLSFQVVLDPEVETLTNMGIQAFPTSILINEQGIVEYIHVGMFSETQLNQIITPYLKD